MGTFFSGVVRTESARFPKFGGKMLSFPKARTKIDFLRRETLGDSLNRTYVRTREMTNAKFSIPRTPKLSCRLRPDKKEEKRQLQ